MKRRTKEKQNKTRSSLEINLLPPKKLLTIKSDYYKKTTTTVDCNKRVYI